MELLSVESEAEFLELVPIEGLAEGSGLPFEGAHHLLGCLGGCNEGPRPEPGPSCETRERGCEESGHFFFQLMDEIRENAW